MTNRLLIISGSSDYTCEKQKTKYEILVEHAKKLKYEKVDILNYPGQLSFDGMKTKLTWKNSVNNTVRKFSEIEKMNIPYDLICLSFGCNVLMGVTEEIILTRATRISLWGPTPQIEYYKILVKNRLNSYQLAKEESLVNYHNNLFEQLPSFELQLAKYKQSNKLMIGKGGNDIISTEAYYKYLTACFKNENRIEFKSIEGLGHSVSEPNFEYFKFLFGK